MVQHPGLVCPRLRSKSCGMNFYRCLLLRKLHGQLDDDFHISQNAFSHSPVSPSLPLPASLCAITFQLESNAGYTMFRDSVKSTGYPLHSPVSTSLPLPASPCAITFQLEFNAGYTMFRDSVKSTGYPLHSPISTSLPLPCVTVCHHI